MFIVFFEDDLRGGEFAFSEVVARAVADAEGEADFAAVAVAEAAFGAVGSEVKGWAFEAHGAKARLLDARQGGVCLRSRRTARRGRGCCPVVPAPAA